MKSKMKWKWKVLDKVYLIRLGEAGEKIKISWMTWRMDKWSEKWSESRLIILCRMIKYKLGKYIVRRKLII